MTPEELKVVDQEFKRFKRKKPKNLDDRFQTAHEEVFETTDCLTCANCCKTTSPLFRDVDIKRISKKLKMSTKDFEAQYLKVDYDGDKVLLKAPCDFLQEDNRCFIYDVRPQACRDYPHTDRKRVVQILDITRKNIEVCPAVEDIVSKIING